jgi:sugar fermentation stimulation protein A
MTCLEEFREKIGSLGEILFRPGYYVYVGSAKRGLEKRLLRHMRKKKKKHWHLDYIFPYKMELGKTYRIRTIKALEFPLAQKFCSTAPGMIYGFGSSDSPAASHLFYYPDNPSQRRDFLDIMLDFQMDF